MGASKKNIPMSKECKDCKIPIPRYIYYMLDELCHKCKYERACNKYKHSKEEK